MPQGDVERRLGQVVRAAHRLFQGAGVIKMSQADDEMEVLVRDDFLLALLVHFEEALAEPNPGAGRVGLFHVGEAGGVGLVHKIGDARDEAVGVDEREVRVDRLPILVLAGAGIEQELALQRLGDVMVPVGHAAAELAAIGSGCAKRPLPAAKFMCTMLLGKCTSPELYT